MHIGEHWNFSSSQFVWFALFDDSWAFKTHDGESFFSDSIKTEVEVEVRGVDGCVFEFDEELAGLSGGRRAGGEYGHSAIFLDMYDLH